MRKDILLRIRNDSNLLLFLKYHSYWYKELLRDPESIKYMEVEMKKEFKQTLEDSMERLNNKVNMIKNILEVIK